MLVDIVGFKMGLKRLVVELIEGIGSQRSLQELLFRGKGARPSLLKENGVYITSPRVDRTRTFERTWSKQNKP